MIVKLIRCQVADEFKEKFSIAQRVWSELTVVEGFVGQAGGWEAGKDNLAVIVAWWRDQPSYDQFMRVNHDPIYKKSGQAGSYESCEVDYWEAQFDIAGEQRHVQGAIPDGALMRLAWCEVRPDRVEHFVQVQKNFWNPAMASAGGMLAGVFSRNVKVENQYLVCTLWWTIAAHDEYRERCISNLRDQSEVVKNVAHLDGFVVHIDPSWSVVGGKISQ